MAALDCYCSLSLIDCLYHGTCSIQHINLQSRDTTCIRIGLSNDRQINDRIYTLVSVHLREVNDNGIAVGQSLVNSKLCVGWSFSVQNSIKEARDRAACSQFDRLRTSTEVHNLNLHEASCIVEANTHLAIVFRNLTPQRNRHLITGTTLVLTPRGINLSMSITGRNLHGQLRFVVSIG